MEWDAFNERTRRAMSTWSAHTFAHAQGQPSSRVHLHVESVQATVVSRENMYPLSSSALRRMRKPFPEVISPKVQFSCTLSSHTPPTRTGDCQIRGVPRNNEGFQVRTAPTSLATEAFDCAHISILHNSLETHLESLRPPNTQHAIRDCLQDELRTTPSPPSRNYVFVRFVQTTVDSRLNMYPLSSLALRGLRKQLT